LIPSVESVVGGAAFLARRYGVRRPPDAEAVRLALQTAGELAADVDGDEPAALFYALASVPQAFPGVGSGVVLLITANHLASLGLALDAEHGELLRYVRAVSDGRVRYDELRAWFASRTRRA
jgi:hypothetical protein